MDGLVFWGPLVVLVAAIFVTSQRARECRTPEGVARERAAMRTLGGWTRRFRPAPGDYTAGGRRYYRAALVLQGIAVAYVAAAALVRATR